MNLALVVVMKESCLENELDIVLINSVKENCRFCSDEFNWRMIVFVLMYLIRE